MSRSILLLAILFTSYAYGQEAATGGLNSGHNRIVILKNPKPESGGKLKLSKQDLALTEELLMKCISKSNSERDSNDVRYLMSLEKYNRQYIPFTQDGQKFVFVNCFCEDVKRFPKWKKQVVTVYDGGGCFFTVLANLSKMNYSDLYINGS